MKFVCDVFNKVQLFCDRYVVFAQNSKEAQKELIARLVMRQTKPVKDLISSVSLVLLNKAKGNVGESLHSLTFYNRI